MMDDQLWEKLRVVIQAINFALQEDICPWCHRGNNGCLGCVNKRCQGVEAIRILKEVT